MNPAPVSASIKLYTLLTPNQLTNELHYPCLEDFSCWSFKILMFVSRVPAAGSESQRMCSFSKMEAYVIEHECAVAKELQGKIKTQNSYMIITVFSYPKYFNVSSSM